MGLCNDSLGVSGDPHFRSWWLGILAGASELARSSDQGLGVCVGNILQSIYGRCMSPQGGRSLGNFYGVWWVIPAMGAKYRPLWWIRTRVDILTSATKSSRTVDLEKEPCQPCTPLIHYDGGPGPI